MNQTIANLWTGALAGANATALMSLVMLLGQKVGHVGKLPPQKIVEAGVQAAGLSSPSEPSLNLLAATAHLGYGMAAGSLYSAALGRSRALPPLLSGIGYGKLARTVLRGEAALTN